MRTSTAEICCLIKMYRQSLFRLKSLLIMATNVYGISLPLRSSIEYDTGENVMQLKNAVLDGRNSLHANAYFSCSFKNVQRSCWGCISECNLLSDLCLPAQILTRTTYELCAYLCFILPNLPYQFAQKLQTMDDSS